MPVFVRMLFRGSVGFVGGAIVGIVGCIILVMALDLVSMLLSFLIGHQLPAISIAFLNEGQPPKPGIIVLTNSALQLVGLVGAVVGAVRSAASVRTIQAA